MQRQEDNTFNPMFNRIQYERATKYNEEEKKEMYMVKTQMD